MFTGLVATHHLKKVVSMNLLQEKTTGATSHLGAGQEPHSPVQVFSPIGRGPTQMQVPMEQFPIETGGSWANIGPLASRPA